MKNILSKEFQPCLESESIELLNSKILPFQFVSIAILIQIQSMTVIYNKQNMMNQEFQHCVESILIEVKIPKMHVTQFVSNVNSIQIIFSKVTDTMKNKMNQEFQHCLELQRLMFAPNSESIYDG
jgi:hypothetical protein